MDGKATAGKTQTGKDRQRLIITQEIVDDVVLRLLEKESTGSISKRYGKSDAWSWHIASMYGNLVFDRSKSQWVFRDGSSGPVEVITRPTLVPTNVGAAPETPTGNTARTERGSVTTPSEIPVPGSTQDDEWGLDLQSYEEMLGRLTEVEETVAITSGSTAASPATEEASPVVSNLSIPDVSDLEPEDQDGVVAEFALAAELLKSAEDSLVRQHGELVAERTRSWDLKASYDAVSAKNSELRDEVVRLNGEVSTLQGQLNTAQQRNETLTHELGKLGSIKRQINAHKLQASRRILSNGISSISNRLSELGL